MNEVVPTFSVRVDADHESISRARREIARWAAEVGADRDALADVELVVTELAANVVDHTTSSWVGIDVELAGDVAVLTVSGGCPADGIPPVERWGLVPGRGRGHGLRIVRALCTTVEVTGDRLVSAVRCGVPLR